MPRAAATKAKPAKEKNPLFVTRSRNFGVGQDVLPKQDLTRYVKWPKYVRLQRQKSVLLQRLKVPPSLNQFNLTLDKHTAAELFRFAQGYKPETKAQKKERLLAAAQAKEAGKPEPKSDKPTVVKFGLNHVTALIEQKKAKLVVIAHDVDPIEIVVWLPALCRKFGVPYCIVKGKARLGAVIHQKQATALAFTDIKPADAAAFQKLSEAVNAKFNKKWEDTRKQWGGHIMGFKSQAATAKLEKMKAREMASKGF